MTSDQIKSVTVKLELKNSRMSSKSWIDKQNKVLEFAFA